MELTPDSRPPRTELGRAARERRGLTEAGRESLRKHGREKGAKNLRHDPEHQRRAQAGRSRESLSEAGKLGYEATARKHGPKFAERFASEHRLLHPSGPERDMIGLLGRLGQGARRDYEREHLVEDPQDPQRAHRVDFAWPGRRLAIQVHGGVHDPDFAARFDPHGHRAALDRQTEEDIRGFGWKLLVVHHTELRGRMVSDTQDRVQRFLAAGEHE